MNKIFDLPYVIGKYSGPKQFVVWEWNDRKYHLYHPDYKKFKNQHEHQTEADCVSMLVGVKDINRFYDLLHEIGPGFSIVGEKAFSELEAELSSSQPVEKFSTKDEDLTNLESFRLKSILQMAIEIRRMIELGRSSGRIGEVLDENSFSRKTRLSQTIIDHNQIFEYETYFHGLSFISWAQQNGYLIPDELRFYRDGKGELQWADPIANGDIEQTFPKHPTGKPKEEDPLYIAVKVREALMDGSVYNVVPQTGRYGTSKQRLQKYVDDKYGKIVSQVKRKEIVSLVNDGAGHGGKR